MKPFLDHVTPQQRATRGDFTPGPHLPTPDASRDTAAVNVLGPSPTQQVEDRPLASVEGGEAGAGNLFERGDVGVIPVLTSAVAAVLAGEAALDWGTAAAEHGWEVCGQGRAGEGSGEGSGSTSLPTGGYQVKPRYPDSARRRGVEGTVVIRAYITEQGRVEQVQVEQSAGHADLDEAAVDAVGAGASSLPARVGKAIAMWVSIP